MDEAQRINITFLHLDIGCTGSNLCGLYRVNRNSCGNDWLQIEEKKFCGEIRTPFSIITNKNTANVQLMTSTIDTRTGFLAIWSAASNEPNTRTLPHLNHSFGSKGTNRLKGAKGSRGRKGTRGNLRGRGKKGARRKNGARAENSARGKKGARRG